jgi:putative copper resistance protein D
MGHAAWTTPLPLLAIIGGLMLFGHSHGDHPAAQKIALHHAVMGVLAITAGSSKLWSTWWRAREAGVAKWDVLWACLILVIGAQLLIYSE